MISILNSVAIKRLLTANVLRPSLNTFVTKTGGGIPHEKNISSAAEDTEFDLAFAFPGKDKKIAEKEPELDKLFSKLEIELRGIDPAVLKSYAWFATTAASHLRIEVGKCWAPYKAHHERMTLLKSVHVHKKHRVQYEVRTYFRFMNFHKLTGSTMDTFLEYIERNLPEGVALQAKKTEIQEIPEHLRQPPSDI